MRLRFHITDELPEAAGTTCGYWNWSEPENHGTLHIWSKPLLKRRYLAAVLGHELLEAAYCKLFGVTTEICDEWDIAFEKRYESGEFPYEYEAGDHPDCPYHRGHRLGVWWEYAVIYGTFAGWDGYAEACFEVMGI